MLPPPLLELLELGLLELELLLELLLEPGASQLPSPVQACYQAQPLPNA